MSSDIMCNGHRFVKSTLFQSPGYLADLSPYISAVISSRFLATPIQLTASAMRPLKPLAQSILPTRASNYLLNGTLTCEYCLHQVSQDAFDDGKICPSLLLEKLGITNSEFILADELLEAQDRRRLDRKKDYLTKPELHHKEQANIRQLESQTYKEDILIMQICPEIGLHAQAFACIDCDKQIDLNNSRLCHYDGRYYCHQCHSGSDYVPIPARVLRSWDFTPKPVCKSSMQKINFLRGRPVLFNLFQINSMLYGFIDRLVEMKQIRERVQSMLKYLEVCGQPDKPFLVPIPKHLLSGDLLNFFTLNDLFDINQVYDTLEHLQEALESHIVRNCESCRGKGFYCELCKNPRDILYPFSKNISSCVKCHTVYHKNCFQRKKKNCPRCIRIDSKRSSSLSEPGSSSQDSLAIAGQETDNSGTESAIMD